MNQVRLSVLIIFIVIANSCNPIKMGTTILVLANKDSIIIAADTKSENIKLGVIDTSFSSGNHKLLRINNTICCISGVANLGSHEVVEILRLYINSHKSLNENSINLTEGLISEYKRFSNSLTENEKIGLLNKDIHTRILLISYKKNIPEVGEITVGIPQIRKGVCQVSYMDPILSQGPGLYKIGITDHIDEKVKNGFKFSKKPLNDMIDLIGLESKFHEKVNSDVDYFILKPNNDFKSGKSY